MIKQMKNVVQSTLGPLKIGAYMVHSAHYPQSHHTVQLQTVMHIG